MVWVEKHNVRDLDKGF